MTELHTQILAFDQLTLRQLHDLLWVRNLVFVVGQKITSEPEIDGRDPACHHALVSDAQGACVATARLFMHEDPIIVGRVAVRAESQGQGVGTRMMRAIQGHLGSRRAALHAQAHLEEWYTRLGWERVGEAYMEAGIAHITMVRGAA